MTNEILVVDLLEAVLVFHLMVLFFRLAVEMTQETMFLLLLILVSLVICGLLRITHHLIDDYIGNQNGLLRCFDQNGY